MMSQLPFDLHVLFIEWVYRHSQADMTDYATLAACALVCRAWTPVAQRLLYRRLPGKFFVGKERLIDTIRRNPALGTHVRRSPIDDLSENSLSLLALFPNLSRLTVLHPSSGSEIPESTRAQVCALNLPITSLELRRTTSVHVIHTLFEVWPTIRYLSVCDLHTHQNDPLPPPLNGALKGIEIASYVRREEMDWLLSTDCATSALAEVDLHLHESQFNTCLAGMKPQRIKSLTCKSFKHIFDAGVGLHAHLGVLEEAVCTLLPDVPIALPRGVRHIGYHPRADGWTQVLFEGSARLTHFLNACERLPALELVTATRSSSTEILLALRVACDAMGVSFDVYPNRESFPRARYVDWM